MTGIVHGHFSAASCPSPAAGASGLGTCCCPHGSARRQTARAVLQSVNPRDLLLSGLIGEVWPVAPLLDALPVSREAAVLDIGGGSGELLNELMLRNHVGPRHLADTLQGIDAHALPFADASFDVVMMLRVLAHLNDPVRALGEARRVLAPDGRLIVVAHGPEHLSGLLSPGTPPVAPQVPGLAAEAFTVIRSVVLDEPDWKALAESYGLTCTAQARGESQLQLVGWVYNVRARMT